MRICVLEIFLAVPPARPLDWASFQPKSTTSWRKMSKPLE
jgi:hypothetical protein